MLPSELNCGVLGTGLERSWTLPHTFWTRELPKHNTYIARLALKHKDLNHTCQTEIGNTTARLGYRQT
jgi:hypothetical protein